MGGGQRWVVIESKFGLMGVGWFGLVVVGVELVEAGCD